MTLVQDGLFDVRPPRKRKDDNPAYRPSRQYAQVLRDKLLAKFQDHHFGRDNQPGCAQCHNARETAAANGTAATLEMCLDGLLTFRAFAQWNRGLREGYYPDRDRPKPPLAAPGTVQPGLFDG